MKASFNARAYNCKRLLRLLLCPIVTPDAHDSCCSTASAAGLLHKLCSTLHRTQYHTLQQIQGKNKARH